MQAGLGRLMAVGLIAATALSARAQTPAAKAPLAKVPAAKAPLEKAPSAEAPKTPLAERYLLEGRLADGARYLSRHLQEKPNDDQARFGLGVIQFTQGVERLAQSLHRYGSKATLGGVPGVGQIPILRLPVPPNPKPEEISYDDLRRVFAEFVGDLSLCEATLAKIEDPQVKLPLPFALVRLDVDGDGTAEEHEKLWRMQETFNRGVELGWDKAVAGPNREEPRDFVIAFDKADVHWLRGYCHLLSAIAETYLAYDAQVLFDSYARHAFDNPKLPPDTSKLIQEDPWTYGYADVIAAIHQVRLPVMEPKRLASAHEHLRAVIAQSRRSWKAIQAEKDNDREWIPGPLQQSVIPNARVTKEMVVAWHQFLDEAELLLEGRKLVPHWRITSTHGVNLKRVFLEPREFDLVLWAHGSGVMPFVERGDCTRQEIWDRFQRTFAGDFFSFAIWFN